MTQLPLFTQLAGTEEPPDAKPMVPLSPDVIDYGRVERHIKLALDLGRYTGAATVEDFLLREGGARPVGREIYATAAGILCFGRDPQMFFRQAVVDFGRFSGSNVDMNDVLDMRRDIGGTLFDQIRLVTQVIWDNIPKPIRPPIPSRVEHIEIPSIPYVIIREATLNLVMHRDYFDPQSVSRVQVFADRVEWTTPGGLLPDMTVEAIFRISKPRNPTIARFLFQARVVERFGYGMKAIYQSLREEKMREPLLENLGAAFILTVYAKDLSTLLTVEQDLNVRQRLILQRIRERGVVRKGQLAAEFRDETSRTIGRDLAKLKELRLIASDGSGRSTYYFPFGNENPGPPDGSDSDAIEDDLDSDS